MNVYLIRHAHAGHRESGGRDLYRPLSPKGQDQALAVADALSSAPIGAVVSSTATRCVQTVQPLASKLGLDIEELEAFWEDSYVADAMEALEKFARHGVAVSSHGNIIPEVVGALADDGMKVKGRGCAKGFGVGPYPHQERRLRRGPLFRHRRPSRPGEAVQEGLSAGRSSGGGSIQLSRCVCIGLGVRCSVPDHKL